MRTLTFLLFLVFFFQTAVGQPRPWMPPKSIAIKVVGTGRTTGHIAWFFATNNTRRAQTLEIPALVIPSTDTHQGYVVPEPSKITIPPGKTIEHPIIGYCTNPDLPAPDAGTILPPLDTWDTGSPIIKTTQEIKRHTTQLQIDGQLTTPLSNNRDRERESVIQQTLWWYSVPAYDPCKQMTAVLGGRDTDWFDYKDVIDRGVSQMIDAIIRVGGAAGIKDYLPPPLTVPLVTAQPVSRQGRAPSIQAKGTGRTTGHIADLLITNPTDKPVNIQIGEGGSLMIPSNGKYQPYVVPYIPAIPVEPRGKVTVPVTGYCVDITRPPVPSGGDMPPLSDWIESPGIKPIRPEMGSTEPGELIRIPVSQALPLDEAIRILQSEHVPSILQGSDCPDIPQISDILIPGTDRRLKAPVDVDKSPAVGAPILLETANRIIESIDNLHSRDMIKTPYSNNKPQEREAVIQQTFWYYSSTMKGEPYTKEAMRGKALEQLESATKQKYDNMPENTRSTFDTGIEDIWGAINLVGAEAKILPSIPAINADDPPLNEIWDNANMNSKNLKSNDDAPDMTTNDDEIGFNDDPSMTDLEEERPTEEPGSTNCICDSLKFDLLVERVKDPVKKNHKEERSNVTKKTITHAFQTEGQSDITDLDVTLDPDLKGGEYFDVSISNVTFKCQCQNAGSPSADCDFFRGAAQKDQSSSKGTSKVDENFRGRYNIGGVKETKTNKDGVTKFKVTPKDIRKDKDNHSKIQIDISAFCFSKDCVIKNQIATECNRSFSIKLSNAN